MKATPSLRKIKHEPETPSLVRALLAKRAIDADLSDIREVLTSMRTRGYSVKFTGEERA